MDIDSIFAEIGDFGRQQKKYTIAIALVHAYQAIIVLQYAIVAKDVDFLCVPTINSTLSSPNATIELNQCYGLNNRPCQSFYYNPNKLDGKGVETNFEYKDESKGSGITSAKESLHTSIVSEWNLVCERAWLRPLTMSVFMVGLLLGGSIFGSIADRIGRKPVFTFTLVSFMICDAVCSFVHSFELYCFFRGVCGYFFSGNNVACYVLLVELLGPSRKGIAGFLMAISFSFGIVFTAGIGALVSGWRNFTLIAALVGVPIIFITLYLPESPRWLTSRAKYDQADAILMKIAKGNGHPFKDKYRQSPPAQTLEENEPQELDLNFPSRFPTKGPFLGFLVKEETRMIAICLFLAWFSVGIGYYSLTFSSVFGKGINGYAGLALSGLVEVPGCALSMFLIGYSRRLTVVFTFITWGILGISFPITLVIPWVKNSFLFFCKSCASANFTVLFMITGELVITSIRNTACGFCSTVARVGAILAPFLSEVDTQVPDLSFVILGLLSLIAGVLWYQHVPETVKTSLPENMDDLIKMKSDTRKMTLNDSLAFCCGRNKDVTKDVRYTVLLQDEDGTPTRFGNENFENVNFDYDDFSSEDEHSDFELSQAVSNKK